MKLKSFVGNLARAALALAATGYADTFIIDNPQATLSGNWAAGTSAANKYGANYNFASTVTGAATYSAIYRPTIATAGKYDVYIWYPQGSNRANNAPWKIVHSGGNVTVPVNQQINGGQWFLIASCKQFAAGTSGYVSIANNTGASGSVVIADAVKIVSSLPPSFTSQPNSQQVNWGASVTFSASATGSGTLTYQWNKNGAPIPGATSSSFTVSPAGPADIATYTVSVSNPVGTIVSSGANLTLNEMTGIAHWWAGENDTLDWYGGQTGVLQNGATYGETKVGDGFFFDGINDYADFGTNAGRFGVSDFTVEFWVESSASGKQPIIGNQATEFGGWEIGFGDTNWPGKVYCKVIDADGDNHTEIVSTSTINDGAWHHVAMSRIGTTISLFIDGALEDSYSTPGISFITGGPLTGGRKSSFYPPYSGFYLSGGLDELTLFGRGLSHNEIQSIYNAGEAGKPNGSPYNVVVKGGGFAFEPYMYYDVNGIESYYVSKNSFTIEVLGGPSTGELRILFGGYGTAKLEPPCTVSGPFSPCGVDDYRIELETPSNTGARLDCNVLILDLSVRRSAVITISPWDDGRCEGDETAIIRLLRSPDYNVVGTDATYYIKDSGIVSPYIMNAAPAVEAEGGQLSFRISQVCDHSSHPNIWYDPPYEQRPIAHVPTWTPFWILGSAKLVPEEGEDADYVIQNLEPQHPETPAGAYSAVFNAEGVADVIIDTKIDCLIEEDESIILSLIEGPGPIYDYTCPGKTGTNYIRDNTPKVWLTVLDGEASESCGDSATIRLSRNHNLGEIPVVFQIAGVTGSANKDDYTCNFSSFATIPDGETFVDIKIYPNIDVQEGVEEFLVKLVDLVELEEHRCYTLHEGYSDPSFIIRDQGLCPPTLSVIASPTKIKLQWNDSSLGEEGYIIERKEGTGNYVALPPLSALIYEDSSITPGVAYTYRIRAFNDDGFSEYSTEQQVTAGPFGWVSGGFNGSDYQLTASGGSGITCNVYGSTDATTWTSLGTVTLSGGTGTFTETGASSHDYRFYRLVQGSTCIGAFGFIKVSVPAGQKVAVVNQLDTGANTLETVLPSIPSGASVMKTASGTWQTHTYSSVSGWSTANVAWPVGEGMFIQNPGAQAFTVTFSGKLASGTLENSVPTGFSFRGAMVPKSTSLANLGYVPSHEDYLYFWNPATDGWDRAYVYAEGYGWVDFDTEEPVVPTPQVGEAFVISHPGTAKTWQMNYSPCD